MMAGFILKNGNQYPGILVEKRLLSMMMIGMMLCSTLSSGISYANPTASSKPSKSIHSATAESAYSISLRQLGAPNAIYLVGQDGRNVIDFNVRIDEVISQATIKLRYRYSPDLLSEQSQINIYLNGESISTIEVSKENGNKDLEAVIKLPPELFSESNQLTFQLIGHYATNCEDPDSPKLWASISNQSQLVVNSLPLLLPNDLANFPIPFLRKYDSRKLVLPFVFLNKPSNTSLEAAGILSSWFGTIRNQTGSQFPVAINTLPAKGNAIVFIESSASISGITLPAITGPMVFIASNPNDPYGKLLFVMGRDSNELKQATTALALGGQTLSGKSIVLMPVTGLPARLPYDAPNWLSSNAPVKLIDLNSGPKKLPDPSDEAQLNAKFNIQIPPALYAPNPRGIPLHLNYSYANQLNSKSAYLSVFYKSQFLKSMSLPMQWEWTSKLSGEVRSLASSIGLANDVGALPIKQSTVYIPQTMIYPAPGPDLDSNTDQSNLAPLLRMDFAQAPRMQDGCPGLGDKTIPEAKINPDSTIDISGMRHFIAMPDLSAFTNSGFPFSRLADLSETAIILSDTPNTSDYSAYLAILARIGRLTGYPGTAVMVTNTSRLDSIKNKDLLVISSGGDNQILLKQWGKNIPDNKHVALKVPGNLDEAAHWFSASPKFDIYQNTFIAGFESPLQSGRSVVLFSSLNTDQLDSLSNSLDGSMGSISGALVRLNEGKVELVTNEQTYHSGSLSWTEYLSWLLSEYVALLISISMIAAVIPSLLIYAALKAKRRKRLQF
jgi:hypothetical protein